MPLFQGFAAHAAGAELLPYKYDPGEIKPNEVEIAISHCGICRSDVHMVDNDWSISHYPLIPGHEIVGKVTITGSAVLGLLSVVQAMPRTQRLPKIAGSKESHGVMLCGKSANNICLLCNREKIVVVDDDPNRKTLNPGW